MTVLLLSVVLVLLTVGVAVLPFVRRTAVGPDLRDPVDDLRRQRQTVYEEILALHSDLTVGQVAREEYDARLREYRLQAARLLQEEERLVELDQDLEAEVLKYRTLADVEEEDEATDDGDLVCPNCNRRGAPGATECSACGAALAGPVALTPHRSDAG